MLTPSPVLDRKANEPKYKCRCGNLFADREPFRTHIIQCKAEFSSRYYVCVCQRVYSLHSEIVNHFLKCQYRPPRNKVERKHHSLPNRQPRNSRDPISATYVPKGSPILMIGSGPQQGALRRDYKSPLGLTVDCAKEPRALPGAQYSVESDLSLRTSLSMLSISEECIDYGDSDFFSMSSSSEESSFRKSDDPFSPHFDASLRKALLAFSTWKKFQEPAKSNQSSARNTTANTPRSGDSEGQTSQESRSRSRDQSAIDEDDNSVCLARKRRRQTAEGQRMTFACPFWKRDTSENKHCHRYTLSRIRDVKQHLHRCHKAPWYCYRCGESFLNEETQIRHIRADPPCQISRNVVANGLSETQLKDLRKKSDPALTEEKQWYAIWNIVFPGDPQPSSPYIDSELSEDLSRFREFWQSPGADILSGLIESSGLHDMSQEERQQRSQAILRGCLDALFEGWRAIRDTSVAEIQQSSFPPGGRARSMHPAAANHLVSESADYFGLESGIYLPQSRETRITNLNEEPIEEDLAEYVRLGTASTGESLSAYSAISLEELRSDELSWSPRCPTYPSSYSRDYASYDSSGQ